MPQEMPEFAMPPAASEASSPAAAAKPTEAVATAAAPADVDRADAWPGAATTGPRRFGWRQLAIVGLVCALIGVAIPFGVQAAQRASATEQVDQLRTVAQRYLAAIADGEAAAATALVPPARTVPVAPDAVLEAATRIEEHEVVHAFVEGDTGVVHVRYRLRAYVYARLLDAERVDGRWQIVTSLAEQPLLGSRGGIIMPTVAGVELGYPAPMLLYPGWYPLDIIESSVYQSAHDGFAVDGLPGTATELAMNLRLSQSLLDEATAAALAYAETCAATGACVWPDTAVVRAEGPAQWTGEQLSRLVFIQVPLVAESGSFNEHVVVEVVLVLDESGAVTDTSCSGLGGQGEESVACGA